MTFGAVESRRGSKLAQIGTLPWYYENGVVSHGDPALAFGPAPDANGTFASKRNDFTIKGVEGIGVSRTDDTVAAAAGDKAAWSAPVLLASTSAAAFADKEQVWADNAASCPHFGNVYVCFANYGGGPSTGSARTASRRELERRRRHVVEAHRREVPGSASGQFAALSGASGCTIRTASDGTVYVFWLG